jgi:alkylated DNA repair dioxygenase AlkB
LYRYSLEVEEEERGRLPLWLHPGDVLFLSGPARWEWRHGIASRAWDWAHEEGGTEEGGVAAGGRVKVARKHRTSVTLRAMRDDVHELKVSA